MTWVWDSAPVGGTELLCLLAIADHADDHGRNAYPSIGTLARKTRMSERSVKRIVHRLIEQGLLTVEQGGGRRSNRYVIHMAVEDRRVPVDNPNEGCQSDTPATPDCHPSSDTGDTPGVTQLCHPNRPLTVLEPASTRASKPKQKPKQTPEQIVQSATDATDAEAAAVVGLIGVEARQEIRSMPAFVRRLADDGDLADWLDRVRADASRETVRQFLAGLPDLPECVHGMHGGGALRPDTGEPQCASCRAVWRARSA